MHIWRRLAVFLCAWVLLLSIAGAALAADYYVRPQGDDNNPGTETRPFQTIGRIIEDLQPGDTLYIGAGTYIEGEFTPKVVGDKDNPVTIQAVAGETVIVDGNFTLWQFLAFNKNDGFVVDGFTLRNFKSTGVSARYSGYITVRNCISYHNGSSGIEMNYADFPHASYNAHMTVENNTTYENGWGDGWASGIHINNKGQGGADSHHVIRNNISYNNYDGSDYHTDGNGIMFDMGGGGSARIENNLCYNNGAAGIQAMDGVAYIINNTCYRNGWDTDIEYKTPEMRLIESHLDGANAGSVVRNNILWARPTRETGGQDYGGVFTHNGIPTDDFDFDHNIIWSDAPDEIAVESWMGNTVKADPLFAAVREDDSLQLIQNETFLVMDADDYDFRLQAGSPGLDAGSSAMAPATDLDGAARTDGSIDIGAYEGAAAIPTLQDAGALVGALGLLLLWRMRAAGEGE